MEPIIPAWAILGAVLVLVASGRVRPDLAALSGVAVLGVLRVAPAEILFSGFSHPAVITVAAVLIVSAGITASGSLRGIGLALAHRLPSVKGQILGLAAITSGLSAFMNNVGALGVTLPAAERMAKRAGVDPASFGMPMAQAGILGGTMTLVGSAPNLIISSYRLDLVGEGFGMFSFLPHGLAALVAAAIVWNLGAPSAIPSENTEEDESPPPTADSKTKFKVMAIMIAAVLGAAVGWLEPPVAFTAAALLMIVSGILPAAEAYRRMNLSVVVFLAGMISMGAVLDHVGALEIVGEILIPLLSDLSDPVLVIAFFLASSALSNAINNSAAAVIMGSLVVSVSRSPEITLATDALLMSVAAGACIALILPTHQATVLAMARTPFPPPRFALSGLLLTAVSAVAAGAVIWWLWG